CGSRRLRRRGPLGGGLGGGRLGGRRLGCRGLRGGLGGRLRGGCLLRRSLLHRGRRRLRGGGRLLGGCLGGRLRGGGLLRRSLLDLLDGGGCFDPRGGGGGHPVAVSGLLGVSRHREKSADRNRVRSEEHTSELQSRFDLVCRLLLDKKK